MEMYETKVDGLYIVFLETEGNSRDGNKSFLDSIDTGEMLRWWDDIFKNYQNQFFGGAESSFKEGFESCEWHKCTHVNIVYRLFQRSVRKKYNTKTFLSLLNR